MSQPSIAERMKEDEMDGHMDVWLSLIYFLLFAVIFLFPIMKILQKAGYSGWWCVLTMVPLLNLILLWVFASARWPNLKEA
jgi:uncharacterized membrane protein YhaH (DUF805 family)